MQVIIVTRKSYPNGDRIDVTDEYITNGYQKPTENRQTYEFTTPNGRQIFHLNEIVEMTIKDDGLGDPSEKIIKQHPHLDWTEWYECTYEGNNIKNFLQNKV